MAHGPAIKKKLSEGYCCSLLRFNCIIYSCFFFDNTNMQPIFKLEKHLIILSVQVI
jgi:hypothetical protein